MVTMSQKEFQRVKVIENAAGGRLSVGEAARLLCNSVNGRCSGSSELPHRLSMAWVQHGNRGPSHALGALPAAWRQSRFCSWRAASLSDSHLCEIGRLL